MPRAIEKLAISHPIVCLTKSYFSGQFSLARLEVMITWDLDVSIHNSFTHTLRTMHTLAPTLVNKRCDRIYGINFPVQFKCIVEISALDRNR